TTTTITSNLSTATTAGQAYSVAFSLTVTAPGAGTPTGTVVISDGTDSCTATLPATSCSLTSTTAGSKTIMASYNGDSNFLTSVSPGVAHVVNPGGKASTTTTITSNLSTATVTGQGYSV